MTKICFIQKDLIAAFLLTLCAFFMHGLDIYAESTNAISLRENDATTLPTPNNTVTFKKELLGQHPRIFFTEEKIEPLRQKMADPRLEAEWRAFIELAKKYAAETPPVSPPNTEDPFRGFGNRLPILSFAFLITKDPKYLTAAKKWIHAINDYPSWANDTDLGAGHICFGMALAYDWLYNELTISERDEIEKSLSRHASILLMRSAGSKYIGDFWGWSYFQNHSWINHTGIAAVAMALYDTNPKVMQSWLDYTRTQFQTTYKNFGVDGSNYEGPSYANYGTEWMLNYVQALASISSENLTDMPYLNKVGGFLSNTLLPDFRNVVNFGDCDPLGRGGIGNSLFMRLAGIYDDAHLEYARQHRSTALGEKNTQPSVFDLISCNPDLKSVPFDTAPLLSLYPDRGLVIFRTSWKSDATIVAFLCGPPAGLHVMKEWYTFPSGSASFGHVNPDANTFLFWADGEWKIGDPAGYNQDKKTRYENTWLVGKSGQRGGNATWFNATTYLGDIPQAHLVTVATSEDADYVIGEAAPAYEMESGLRKYRRHLLFVKHKSPYLVIFDQLESDKEQTWSSYLHAYVPFQIVDSNYFEISGTTKSYGIVFGPKETTLGTRPLKVTDHGKNVVERGFELMVDQSTESHSTWLVTIIMLEKRKVQLLQPAPCPIIGIDSDRIEWDGAGGVSLNGRLISGNRLKDTD